MYIYIYVLCSTEYTQYLSLAFESIHNVSSYFLLGQLRLSFCILLMLAAPLVLNRKKYENFSLQVLISMHDIIKETTVGSKMLARCSISPAKIIWLITIKNLEVL